MAALFVLKTWCMRWEERSDICQEAPGVTNLQYNWLETTWRHLFFIFEPLITENYSLLIIKLCSDSNDFLHVPYISKFWGEKVRDRNGYTVKCLYNECLECADLILYVEKITKENIFTVKCNRIMWFFLVNLNNIR